MDDVIDQAVNNVVTDDIDQNTPMVKVVDTQGNESLDDALTDFAPTFPDF